MPWLVYLFIYLMTIIINAPIEYCHSTQLLVPLKNNEDGEMAACSQGGLPATEAREPQIHSAHAKAAVGQGVHL